MKGVALSLYKLDQYNYLIIPCIGVVVKNLLAPRGSITRLLFLDEKHIDCNVRSWLQRQPAYRKFEVKQ